MRWMKSARHQGWEIRRNRSCGRQSSPSAGRPPVEKRPLPACCRRWSIWARPWAAPSRARRPWKRFGCRRGTCSRPRGHVRHAGGDRPHSVERRRRSGAGRGGSSPGGYTGQGGGCAGTGGERRRGPHGQRRAGRGREGRGGRMAGTGRGGSGPAGRRRTRHRRGSAAGKASGTGRRPGGSVSGPGQDVGESGFPGIPPRRGPGRRLLGAGRGAHHHHPSH